MVGDEYNLRCMMRSDIVDHLPRLHAEASSGDAVVLELGVRSGNSTAAFLAAVEVHGGAVYSVDIDRPKVPWFGHPQWVFIQGNDLDLVNDLPDGVDVLFIDTSHLYKQTWAELEAFVPKVRPGGVVLMHDTELEVPDGSPVGDPVFPVRTAIDEFCVVNGLVAEFVEGCYGLGVIRIPEEVS
jgi:predicted O-methyltransferase YrrM